MVRLPLGPVHVVLVSEPRYIEQILVTDHAKFDKGLAEPDRLLGDGLLTSDGALWRRQRRILQPAFQTGRLFAYARAMVGCAERHVAAWRPGERRDVTREMAHLTIAIVAATLLGDRLGDDAPTVSAALTVCLEHHGGNLRSLGPGTAKRVRPADLRFEGAARQVDAVVRRLIETWRPGEESVISLLLDGGVAAPQVRDEIATLLVAGFETTATALAWTWYLLAAHPAVEARLHDELRVVLAGRAPDPDDLPHLPYANAAITEAMRLYPPAWVIRRRSLEPFTLGPHAFAAGTTVLMSQWVVHPDPRHFPQPEAFRPERWLHAEPAPYTYFPFGGGPRLCIGHRFARIEAALIVATIAQRFRLRHAGGRAPRPRPLSTLRPGRSLTMVVEAR